MKREGYQEKMERRKMEIKSMEDIIDKGGYCVLCGYHDDPRIIENHHIAGKSNSDITIPVCPNCHQQLTQKQEPLKEERNKELDNPLRILAFVLEGIAHLLILIAKVILGWVDRILSGDFHDQNGHCT